MKYLKWNSKVLTVVVVIMGLTGIAKVGGGNPLWPGKVLTRDEVKKRWGDSPIDLEKFKNGNEESRARFAYAIIVNEKKYIGKSVNEIRSFFGQPDGFYFKDIFPAYLIQLAKTQKDEAWQIVFSLNNKGVVDSVFVHKNCCD